jgi:hypothetical protein
MSELHGYAHGRVRAPRPSQWGATALTTERACAQDYDVEVAMGIVVALVSALVVIYNECVASKKDAHSSAESSDQE